MRVINETLCVWLVNTPTWSWWCFRLPGIEASYIEIYYQALISLLHIHEIKIMSDVGQNFNPPYERSTFVHIYFTKGWCWSAHRCDRFRRHIISPVPIIEIGLYLRLGWAVTLVKYSLQYLVTGLAQTTSLSRLVGWHVSAIWDSRLKGHRCYLRLAPKSIMSLAWSDMWDLSTVYAGQPWRRKHVVITLPGCVCARACAAGRVGPTRRSVWQVEWRRFGPL